MAAASQSSISLLLKVSRSVRVRAVLFMMLSYAGLALVLFSLPGTVKSTWIEATARSAASVLSLLGAQAQADGSLVTSRYGAVQIIPDCTGVFPVVVLTAAILAFPSAWRLKLFGLAVGVPSLLAINMTRILSLVFAGYFLPGLFETLHHLVWPAVIIFSSIVLFMAWARLALNERWNP